jgi:Kef-type K+ transport system membrane component KefB
VVQDLVTVPFLVLLPVLEDATASGNGAGVAAAAASAAGMFSATAGPFGTAAVAAAAAGFSAASSGDSTGWSLSGGESITNVAQEFLPTAARSLGLMGAIALFGRLGLRRVFEAVARTGSGDAFVATCLVTVLGTSMATEMAGFGQTLGAFLAGVLLAETSFRPQVEAEVKPFKGILLGLFFVCTGAAVDVPVLLSNFPTIALLTVGLISVKFTITSVAARSFGLTEAESVKVGLTLAQGGEFAFVLLALAQDLHVLPEDLNALLICVVVLSMATTPLLAEWGDWFEAREAQVCVCSSGHPTFSRA